MGMPDLNSLSHGQSLSDWKVKQQIKGIKTLMQKTQFDIQTIRSIQDEKEKLKAVASEFESMFVEMMFKSMKKTLSKDSLLDGGFAERVFDDMLLTERSRVVAREQSLGIAKMIYDQNAKYL